MDLPLFIQPQQLDDVLDNDDIQVIAVADAAPHAQSRIPYALQIQMRDITTGNPPTAGLLPDAKILANALGEAGLRNDKHIVVYDLSNGTQAARLVYTLLAAGHDAVSMLDGGLNAWLDADFDLEMGMFDTPETTTFEVNWQPGLIADRQWIEAHLDNEDVQIIDARTAEEYAGSDVRSARGGHIPGAINLDWRQLVQANGCLKTEPELRQIMADHGINADKESVSYCQSHVRSSFVLLVLRSLGHTRTRGYPGAWSDWGNNENTPVAH